MTIPDGAIWKTFTPEELEEIALIARRRHTTKNPKYRTDKRIAAASNFWMNEVSTRGEWAVGCTLLDLPVTSKMGLGGLPWQFEYYGVPFQIKTMKRRLMFPRLNVFRAPFVILCNYFDHSKDIRITAWIDHKKFIEVHKEGHFNHGLTYYVDYDQMYSIPDLIRVLDGLKREKEGNGK